MPDEGEPNGTPVPASLIQQQFWLLHQLVPSLSAYNLPCVSLIEGELDVAALETALNVLVRRHRILRAVFAIDAAGRLMQKAAPWQPVRLPLTDLRSADGGAPAETAVERALTAEIARPFDLVSGPPLRFRLFRTGGSAYLLAITAHHVVFDLATKDLFARQLAEEYRAALAGGVGAGAAETAAYESFSLWQERWLQGPECKKMEDAWRSYLGSVQPLLDAPAGGREPAGDRGHGAVVPIRFDGEARRLIGAFCREENVAPFLVLLTAWALTLAGWSGRTRFGIGVPLTNRRKDEFKQVMGCFVNILPLVFDVSGSPSLREALRGVRQAMLKMHRMQEIPYPRLVQLMRDAAAAGSNPFFQAGFTFEHPMRLQLEGVRVTPRSVHNGGAQLDLFASFREDDGVIVGHIEYDTARFTDVAAAGIAGRLQAAVLDICRVPEQKVDAAALAAAAAAGRTTGAKDCRGFDTTERAAARPGDDQQQNEMLSQRGADRMNGPSMQESRNGAEIAIIGMAGRFPGAATLDQYWRNLRDGVESISFFTDRELADAGVDPSLLGDPGYVKARGILEGAELFDPAFFGLSPREAETMDPQQRLLLECAWEALESSGYDADRYPGLIGLYAGTGQNSYFLNNVYPNREVMRSIGDFQAMLGNDKDFAATRASYKMNLRGPSIVVQSACSTSLVAVAQACQSLLSGESDIALAGACTLAAPQTKGYQYQAGGINSPDGHCRPFDAKAQGTVFSNAAGIVVLKRLDEALADGDCIHAVIKAAAVNNDGSLKAGYTAPSVEGQAKVIATAQLMADVAPGTITYVEAHGSATALGDPIEIAALTQAFGAAGKKGFCALGSVKANIGHTDTAAGIAGLIKTVLMLKHRMIPPCLHFETPNPGIDLANSPFFVNARLSPWRSDGLPLRAGVSAFGVGGTNVHVILEEAPEREPSGRSRPWKLVLVSARSAAALDGATGNLARHLKEHPSLDLADAAYTLQKERKVFDHRRMAVCADSADAAAVLESMDRERVLTSVPSSATREVVFLFSGQGSQYVDMGRDLYRTERVFREQIDRCSELLKPRLGMDLRAVLYPGDADREQAAALLTQTGITQPALFTVEYALAQLWMSWGVVPAALLGHSIGEYTAACLAGVFSLEDALALVAVRSRLMQDLHPGSMLVVPLSEKQLLPYLNDRLSLAVINGPSLCVASGEKDAVEELKARLAVKNVQCRYLQTSHAFHSHMMEPILDAFTAEVRRVGPRPPRIPLVSNVTGKWLTAGEATDPAYWTRHLRRTVRFSDCLQELMREPGRVLLEVGPGYTFTVLVNQQRVRSRDQIVLSSMRTPKAARPDSAFILHTLGQLWLAGVRIDWQSFTGDEQRHRVPLPTYPFERKRCWLDPVTQAEPLRAPAPALPETPERATCAAAEPEALKKDKDRPASQDEIARTILNIWRESLGHDRVTVHDNFFELGGNSLIALRMISQTEKAFGTKLPLSLFKAPTVEQLVNFIVQEEEAVS